MSENGEQPVGVVVNSPALPDVVMVVNEGSQVSPGGDDKTYYGGEEVTVDGPTAIALQSGGYATVKE